MKKHGFDADFEVFFNDCLKELKARANWSEAFIPLLERYVTITAKLSKLNSDIVDAELTVEHTNKLGAKNQVSNPDWRMFVLLNTEANKMAQQLGLSPDKAPVNVVKEIKKGVERFTVSKGGADKTAKTA
jgi:hypothetical protein